MRPGYRLQRLWRAGVLAAAVHAAPVAVLALALIAAAVATAALAAVALAPTSFAAAVAIVTANPAAHALLGHVQQAPVGTWGCL